MAQIRIGFDRVAAGSSARAAEQERRSTETPRCLRVPAGSAARVAEEAKRANGGAGSMGASFSLRAAGGRVQRLPEATPPASAPASAAPDVATPATPVQASLPQASAGMSGAEKSFSPARSPAAVAGRLKSVLRGLFLPEVPPQP